MTPPYTHARHNNNNVKKTSSSRTENELTFADIGLDRNALSASAKELWNCPRRPSTSDRISKPENPFGAASEANEQRLMDRLS